jgi:hypothetical protein
MKGPLASRSTRTCSTNPSPTLRTADNPNGMTSLPSLSFAATKSDMDRLTSGTSTGIDMVRHSLR